MEKYAQTIKFIRKLFNEPDGFIPLHAPVFGGNELKYLEECINSTFVSSIGKFVVQFEEKMAEFTGVKKSVACVNGTNALHLALLIVGVESGTEVITQPLTFIATANAIKYCSAEPVFLDVDLNTMGLSPKALREWLESSTDQKIKNNKIITINKKTKKRISACIPMHTFGHPCRIDEIVEICDEYNIPVVEDAAESLGSFYKNQHTGTFGQIGILSFNGNKILTTGGGGMMLFKDDKLAYRAKHLTSQAKVPHPWEFVHDEIGYNYRMPNINAALGLAQLEQLPRFLVSKRKNAKAYNQFFEKLNIEHQIQNTNHRTPDTEQSNLQPLNSYTITFIPEPPNARSNYWLNCIFLSDRDKRDEFLKYSNENGVMTRPAWHLMNKLPMFSNCQSDLLVNANELSNRLVNIPSSAHIV